MESSRGIFALLQKLATVEPGNHHRPVEASLRGQAASHVIEADGKLAFYVAVPAEEEFRSEVDALGFVLEVKGFGEFASGRALMLRLRDEEMEAPFASMIDDVLERHAGGNLPLAASLREVVDDWRHMFDDSGRAVLTIDRQIGLLAELHLLELMLAGGRASALGEWMHGGANARHDFATAVGDVEVKATRSRESFVLSIHGLDQLASDADRPLHLYAEQLELHPSGETLPEAIARVRTLVSSAPEFGQKLAACGYLEALESHYTERFRLLRRKARAVDDGIPRLTKSMLPTQADPEWIKAVQYQIDFGPVDGVEGDAAVTLVLEALSGS